ncbi:MAG: hypothetical protein OXE78_09505 [Gammaproteobacteria bacterium]|nr:hypothetical protein [Gammaproteobacteria bacterium]MCY4357524.1 hypothetical protein [Gammaproteobacteria bacterium]
MGLLYRRTLEDVVKLTSNSFLLLSLTDPWQVGKSTLLELCAGTGRKHFRLDDFDVRTLARNDPDLFIHTYSRQS